MADDETTVGLPVGTKIGKYEVRQRLGIGGQAIVYKCHDPLLDRDVAIKQISSHLAADPEFVERFRKEAQILAKLGAEQPAIVTIHELVQDDRGLFIVMEFVAGHSLETVLRENPGPTEPKAAVQVIWRLAAALNAVHRAGVIHRDIKPGNIIIGEGLRAKIADFGVAASMSAQASMPLGTTKYMAPELFEGGEVDGRVDMYSLGFIAYEVLIGREKFNEIFADVVRDPQGEVLRWMKWHGNRSVTAPKAHEVNQAVPAPLAEIVAKMMAKDPAERYANMEDLGRAIKTNFSPRAKAAQVAAAAPPALMPRPQAPPGTGLEAEDLRIPAPAAGEPAAPPGEETEGPPTARIPKEKLSRKAKLIIAGAAGALVIIGCVVALVVVQVRRGNLSRRREDAYKNAYDKYQEALPPENDRETFEKAVEDFQRVRADFGGTKQSAMAYLMIPLCKAHLAVIDEDWIESAKQKADAEERRKELQAKLPGRLKKDLDTWLADRGQELRDFNDYLTESRMFSQRLKFAGGLMDAVALLDKAWVRAGAAQASDKAREVTEARGRLGDVARGQDPEEAKYVLDAARELDAVEKQLLALPARADAEEVRAIVSDAKSRIVEMTRATLDSRLPEYPSTRQQRGAVAAYRDKVERAENEVEQERARRQQMFKRLRKGQWVREVERQKGVCLRHVGRARDLAKADKIAEAREALKDASEGYSLLTDQPLPDDLSGKDRSELSLLKENTLREIASRIGQANAYISTEERFQKVMDDAKAAAARGDRAAELQWLREALRIKPDARPRLEERIKQVQIEVDIDAARKAKDAGQVQGAIKRLEDILSRDPKNAAAVALLAECRGLVKWAELVQKAERDMKAGKWTDALRELQEARKIRREPILDTKISECRYRIGLAEADAHKAAGKFAEEVAALEKLRRVKPAAALMLETRIMCAMGDAELKKQNWLKARAHFDKALDSRIIDDELKARAKSGFDRAMYSEAKAKAEAQFARGDYRTAAAYARNAEKYARTAAERQWAKEFIEACRNKQE